jgi:hypothetical protein
MNGIPSPSIQSAANLRSPQGGFMEGALNGQTRLTAANDYGDATFAEIAAFIRANPEKVFLP